MARRSASPPRALVWRLLGEEPQKTTHVVLLKDVLHEGLAALELGSRFVGTEGKDLGLFESVDDSGSQRILRANDYEVNCVGLRPFHNLLGTS